MTQAPTPDGAPLTPLQRAFLALEQARARVAQLEQAASEPIAVIGLGCRVPGADGPQEFWRLLRDEVDAIGPVPADRWDADALYDPDPEVPGRISTRQGGFLRSIDGFDPAFFGIAPREAQGMDPQQRLLLEVTWEALEHAAQAPDRLERSRTGVFIGACSGDYAYLQLQSGDTGLLDAHFTSGIAHSVLSGRLSYLLGLQGPSVTIDTACSSSLVAVHLACQSLRSGESRMALAGGVNLILSPDLAIALSHSRMLAPDGRCKTFDAAADGFARAEGCGMVVLKRLSDAQADGDRVLALIRGSAVNQDGPSSSLTAPNGPAQEAVVRAALAQAGLAPRQVGYIEAHGTGTQLGDPLEVHALGAVFGADRQASQPLVIGSVKTNIGHLEGAAGVTGLIKLVLSLQHRRIPAHLHFRTPSPHIAWGDGMLKVPAEAMDWPAIDGRRIGGVSSFGFSGTNAHVIVEEMLHARAPDGGPAEPALRQPLGLAPAVQRGAHLMALSAKSPAALAVLAARHAAALEGRRDDELADICHTANAGRAHFAHRAAIVAHSIAELRDGLQALAQGMEHAALRTAHVTRRDPPKAAFLFTGQGSQYAGMGRGLYEAAPVFREVLDRCAALLAPLLDRPLLELLFPAEGQPSPIDQTAYTQPALFALEVALAQLLRSWGVEPRAAIGHSVGEVAAACVAGVMSLEDGLKLIAERGRLMQSLPSGGAMAALQAEEAVVAAALARRPGAALAIAAVNMPRQTVVSGAADEVRALCDELAAQGVKSTPLTVSHAFHSPLVDPILGAFEQSLAGLRFARPQLRLVSNLTGGLADGDEITRPTYWRRHVREAVRFEAGARTLAEAAPDLLIELGPQPVLLGFVEAAFPSPDVVRVPTLRKGRDDWEQMLQALASLYLAGAPIDWRGVDQGLPCCIVDLPTYPFQRERFWFSAKPKQPAAHGRDTGHPLLGARWRSAGSETVFESRVAADQPGFVREHRVQGHVVMPATAYLDTLLAAAQAVFGHEQVAVEEVSVHEAMLLTDDGAPRSLQVVCSPPAAGGAVSASLSSAADDEGEDAAWVRHVEARLAPAVPAPQAGPALPALRERCPGAVALDRFYDGFVERGLDFGPAFRSLRTLQVGEHQALGEVVLDDALQREAAAYRIHPVLLDGCLQVTAAAIQGDAAQALHLPVAIGRFVLHGRAGTRCFAHVTAGASGPETQRADVRVFAEDGRLIAELGDVRLKRVAQGALSRLGERWLDDALYEPRWQPAPLPAPLPVPAMAEAAAQALPALRERAALDAYDRFLPRLEALCVDYVLQAFARLGWQPAEGETVMADALAERLRVIPAHRRLFARLLAILGEAGHLARDGEGWRVKRGFVPVQPEAQRARLAAECPEGAVELEFTARVAGEFAEALRGEREPMQLLFPGGSLDTAERLYRDTPTARFYNGLMAEAIAAAAAAAGERPLRILEIGAGTGGTTAHVVPRLAGRRVEYTFTDIGQHFVNQARERFGAHGFMRFQAFDLEHEPQSQGLAPASFDLVIASNVVHATADLRRTLQRIRGLLAPGGVLAMLEVTAPQRWFDLTVGLTEGWWAFSDTDLRPDYATLPRAAWCTLLQDQGFEVAATLPAQPAAGSATALQSLLLARKRDTEQGHWLLLADEGGTAASLAARLREQGARCTLAWAADEFDLTGEQARIRPAVADDHRRLLASLRERGETLAGVVHAWSLDTPAWDRITPATLRQAQQRGPVAAALLAQSLLAHTPAPRLWLLTRGAQATDADDTPSPAASPVWGVAKALALEHPELRAVCCDLDPADGAGALDALGAELAQPGSEPQVAWRAGQRRVARLARLRRLPAPPEAAPYRLAPVQPGSMEAFERQPLARRAPGAGEVEIAVEATGLNFKDLLKVLGMVPGQLEPLGGECAGRVVAVGAGVSGFRPGDAVLALANGCLGSHAIARAEFVHLRPAGMGAEEGAAFPIAFLTAEFCLSHLAGLRAGDCVLVHAAAGGVGMAAVQLAQRAGAEVIATAGSPAKRQMLRALGVRHVLDSRTTAFAEEVRALTGGRGADVVLNSLAGDALQASFDAIADGGRFIEIGKRGIKSPAEVEALGRGLRYFIVDWSETAQQDPALIARLLAQLVDALREGRLHSLPRHVFDAAHTAQAFRFMAQARHHGKVVVRHGGAQAPSIRRDGTYLVSGGLSGLGPLVGRWLAERGAGRVVLLSRRGVTPEAAPMLDTLRALGTQVVAEALDITDAAALRALLARLRASGPPLRGVIHSAGVLADAGLLQQDAERFERVLAPKVGGGALLDEATRGDPLDFFVLFASVAGVLGSRGQANHSAANVFLDVLAHERRSRGLPGLSIDWGAWAEVGAAVDRGMADRLAAQGIGTLSPEQGLLALERLLGLPQAQAAVLPVDWRRYLAALGHTPALLADLATVAAPQRAEAAGAATAVPAQALAQQVAQAPEGRRRPLVAAFVREKALRSLGVDPARAIDPRTPLGDLGLDSLLAVELRNTLGRALGRTLPATLLFDHPSLDALTDFLLAELQPAAAPAPAAAPGPQPEPSASLVDSIEDLSDEEVERLLAARAKKGS